MGPGFEIGIGASFIGQNNFGLRGGIKSSALMFQP